MTDRYLITGATGFIGSHLVEALLAQKIPASHITLLVQPKANLSNLPKLPFHITRGDIRDPRAVKEAIKGASYVYHLAAVSGLQSDKDEDYLSVNVGGTKNVVDACKKNPLKKFVFFSSIAVYGLPAWVGDIINWDETKPHHFSEVYGQSKAEAENIVVEAHQQYDLPYVIIRPTSVYGPRDRGQLYGLYKAIYRQYFVMIGNGNNVLDMVFVNDIVDGAIHAAKNTSSASDYILGATTPTKFKDIVRNISRSTGRHMLPITIPKSVALPLSVIVSHGCSMIGIHSPIFPSRVKVMTSSY